MNGTGCKMGGVCGKTEAVAHMQDTLVVGARKLAEAILCADKAGVVDVSADDLLFSALFSTLTNVDFDSAALKAMLVRVLETAENLRAKAGCEKSGRTAASLADELLLTAPSPDAFAENEDVRSALQTILFGLKGVAAYAYHAQELGCRDHAMVVSAAKCLAASATDGVSRSLEDWLALALEVGRINVRAMQLLDEGNTKTYGDPTPTPVSLGHRKGHAILVSGHDLKDLYEILKAVEGTDIYVYTHGEMIPTHAYPKLRAFKNFAGHFGTAWQNQIAELPAFPGPVVFTTNCIQYPGLYQDKVFTSGVVQWPGCVHISNGDWSPVIRKALEMPGYAEDEEGQSVTVGFGRKTLLDAVPAIIDAVKAGAVKHVFLVAGCDGIKKERQYYADFVEQTPKDTLILTLGCGKYKFFKKQLGNIGPFPRLLDVGQCNDAYAAVVLALKLAETLKCTVNDLPLSLVLSWYEQKAAAILLSLLYLGVKNVRIGPSLPAFISPTILKVLSDRYGLKLVTTPEADLKAILG